MDASTNKFSTNIIPLNLRYPPRFTLASSEEEANEFLHKWAFDLIVIMPNNESIDTFNYPKRVKEKIS